MVYRVIISILALIVLSFFNCCNNSNNILFNSKPISKALLEIARDTGMQKIEITDIETLKKIDVSLKNMVDTNIQSGGLHEIWAILHIYKQKGKDELFIQNNKYNGWYIIANGKTLYSQYLIDLVRMRK